MLTSPVCIVPTVNQLSMMCSGVEVGVGVAVTFVLSTLMGLTIGVCVTYLAMHLKTHKAYSVSTEATTQQSPPTPGPLYEQVSQPQEEIELKTNTAYGPIGQ